MKKIYVLLTIALLLFPPLTSLKAGTLSDNLKGKILLQVQAHGEAWYVNPKDGLRYYMANGNEAYNIMRNLGVGITNTDLDKMKTNKSFAKKNSGKIFLQVQSHGEAYYIDFNGIAHYLKDGTAAYTIMRELGLGITNPNLEKIQESKSSGLSSTENIKANSSGADYTDDNFREVAITMYAQTAEFFKRAIEETENTDITNINNRKNKINNRINIVRNISFPNSGDGAVLNRMFDLYEQEHQQEIDYIDKILAYVKTNLSSMRYYKNEYDNKVSFLLKNPEQVVTRTEMTSVFEKEKNFIDTQYQFSYNIIDAMRNFYQNIINKEDDYATNSAIIQAALAKASEPTITKTQYYQPLPQTDYSLTTRQQLLLNPISCTISGDGVGIQLYVSCH